MCSAQVTKNSADVEIDLRKLAAALQRRSGFILFGALSGLVGGTVFTLISSPLWEGEFQIVLSPKQNVSNSSLFNYPGSGLPLDLIGGLGRNSELETQIKILESPSVLRPVFDLVNSKNSSIGTGTSNILFRNWVKDSLSIKLEKGTSVLSVSYRDTNKSMVLPVLHQISSTYQKYSGRDRLDSISRGLDFVNKHLAEYRLKAAASSRALDNFAIRYGISSVEGTGNRGLSGSFNIGSFNLGSGSSNRILPSQTSPGTRRSTPGNHLEELAGINKRLIRLQQQFTNRDPLVQALISERNALKTYIEMTAGGLLALPGQQPKSKEEAQELSVKYKELERRADRDTSILDSLESTLLSLQLEKAKSTKPWELISQPTLLATPVSPSLTRNLAMGLLVGLFAGTGSALVVDRSTGRIYSKEEILKEIPVSWLTDLPVKKSPAWNDRLKLLVSHGLKGSTVALLPLGDLNRQEIDDLCDGLRKIGITSAEICRTPLETEHFDQLLLLASSGSLNRKLLRTLQQDLNLLKKPTFGLIWLESGPAHA